MLRKLLSARAGAFAICAGICLLVGLLAACQFPSSAPDSPSPPAPELLPALELPPAPTASPLSDAEALALIEEELAARGVDLETVRLSFREEPRALSLRFTSAYDFESAAYKAQSILITLLVSRISLRVQPPVDDGIKLSIIPQGSDEVGLHIISIMGSSLEAWAEGSLSDQEFVAEWTVGILTKE